MDEACMERKVFIMVMSNIVFPQISIINYKSEELDCDLYHLYINGEYEGCYQSKADLLERLSLLSINEVSRL